jgi:RNA polymerase sigma factor (sigma-70 family)
MATGTRRRLWVQPSGWPRWVSFRIVPRIEKPVYSKTLNEIISGVNKMDMSREYSAWVERALKADKELAQNEQDLKDYVKLILSMAKSYIRNRVEWEDLCSVGIIGLLEARRHFDPTRSENFKAYASLRIKGEMYAYCQSNTRLLKVPVPISKGSSYVEKIYSILDNSAAHFTNAMVDRIVSEFECELESALSTEDQRKIRYAKDRIANIAKNSRLTYETLVSRAKHAIVSVVPESALPEYSERDYSVEDEASKGEVQDILKNSLGERRFRVLQLHYQGYSNPKIAQMLDDEGITKAKGKPISRSAVKNILDNALQAITEMELFRKEDHDGDKDS